MARAVTHCPDCGQRVTPFAAGCAVCGADLEKARAAKAARPRIELPRARWYGGVSSGRIVWIHVVIAFVAALAAAPFGLLLALYWANRYYHEGNTPMMAAMLAAGALAVAALLAPVWFWSHLLGV